MLTEAQRARLLRDGECLVPRHLSWRKADYLRAAGLATLDPFFYRWMGQLRLTFAGRTHLAAPEEAGSASSGERGGE